MDRSKPCTETEITGGAGVERAKLGREKVDPLAKDFPDVNDGLRGMLFIDTVLASTKSKQKWTKFKK